VVLNINEYISEAMRQHDDEEYNKKVDSLLIMNS